MPADGGPDSKCSNGPSSQAELDACARRRLMDAPIRSPSLRSPRPVGCGGATSDERRGRPFSPRRRSDRRVRFDVVRAFSQQQRIGRSLSQNRPIRFHLIRSQDINLYISHSLPDVSFLGPEVILDSPLTLPETPTNQSCEGHSNQKDFRGSVQRCITDTRREQAEINRPKNRTSQCQLLA